MLTLGQCNIMFLPILTNRQLLELHSNSKLYAFNNLIVAFIFTMTHSQPFQSFFDRILNSPNVYKIHTQNHPQSNTTCTYSDWKHHPLSNWSTPTASARINSNFIVTKNSRGQWRFFFPLKRNERWAFAIKNHWLTNQSISSFLKCVPKHIVVSACISSCIPARYLCCTVD